MLAVEHVIKLFDPDFNARTISARRRQKTNPWFKRGTLFREALDVLRTATGPLTVAELTAGVLAAKNGSCLRISSVASIWIVLSSSA